MEVHGECAQLYPLNAVWRPSLNSHNSVRARFILVSLRACIRIDCQRIRSSVHNMFPRTQRSFYLFTSYSELGSQFQVSHFLFIYFMTYTLIRFVFLRL